jgi:hypothetical protein
MTPRQAAAWGKLEDDPSGRLVLEHRIADRPVAAAGTDAERAIEDHRLRHPDVGRPQSIVGAPDRVENLADHGCRCSDLSLVNVVDPGHRFQPSIRCSTVVHTLPYGRGGCQRAGWTSGSGSSIAAAP